MALHTILSAGELDVGWLLTTVNDQHDRVSMHGVRTSLLTAQAEALGIPLVQVRLPDTPTMDSYECAMTATLTSLRDQGAEIGIFGDIFLEDLRLYRERRLAELGLHAVFPLWQRPTTELVHDVIKLGFKAITTCINEQYLGKEFVGRVLDERFIAELPSNVDPCGENGEFHTFAYEGPIFSRAIPIQVGEIVHRTYERPTTTSSDVSYDCQPATTIDPYATGFWYCDIHEATS